MTEPRMLPLGLSPDRLVEQSGPEGGEIVGADDALADARRAGADVDLTGAQRDTDGVPVGAADAEADRHRAAGE